MAETQATIKGVSGEMNGATKTTGGLVSKIGKFVGTVGGFKAVNAAINMVTGSIGAAVKRVDTLNNSDRVFSNMGFSVKETKAAMDNLNKSITGLPTPLDEAVQGVQLIASSTGDLGKSEKIFSSLNNGILGFGGTTAQVQNAVVQLSQAFSNGKIDGQTWNSMINSGLGPALNALGKQMGLTTGELKEGLSSGSISVEKFQDALIDLNVNGGGGLKSLQQIAKDSTNGIGTGLSNMRTAVVRGVASIISAVDETLKSLNLGSIGTIIGKVGSTFEGVLKGIAGFILNVVAPALEKFSSWINNNKSVVEAFSAVVIALGTGFAVFKIITTVVTAFNTLKTALIVVKGAMAAFNAVMLANPIALVIAVVAGLIAGIVYLWKTNEGFRTAIIGIWESIKTAFVSTKEAVLSAWDNVISFFAGLWESIKGGANIALTTLIQSWEAFKSFLATTWDLITAVASTAWTSFSSIIMGIVQPFISVLMNSWDNAKNGLSTIWNGIKQIASATWELVKNVILAPILLLIDLITGDFNSLKSHLSQIWNNIKSAASSIWNGIKSVITGVVTVLKAFVSAQFGMLKTALSNVWNGIKQIASSVWSGIKSSISFIVSATVNTIKITWNNFKSFISNLFSSIKNASSNAWNSVKSTTLSIVSSMVNGAKNAWNMLTSSVRNTVNTVKNVFSSLRSINLFSIGQNIIQGLVNGIRNMVGAVGRAISDVASNIKGKIKGALGIHSPSRFMRDMIGKNMMLGWEIGIDKEGDSPLDAVTEVTDNIKKALMAGSIFNSDNNFATAVPSSNNIHPTSGNFSSLMIGREEAGASAVSNDINITVQSMVVRKESDIRKIGQELVREADRRAGSRGKRRWDD